MLAQGTKEIPAHPGQGHDWDYESNRYLITNAFIADRYPRLVEFAAPKPHETVLDAACGPGLLGILAAERMGRAENVVYVDASVGMIKTAKRESERRFGVANRTHFLKANLVDPDVQAELLRRFPGGFDVVFLHHFLHFFPTSSKTRILTAMLALCKPGGRVVFDSELPGASRHIHGPPHAGTTLGVREWQVQRVEFKDFTMAMRPKYRNLVTVVGWWEQVMAKQEAIDLCAQAGGYAGKIQESLEEIGAKSEYKGVQEAGLAAKGKEMKGAEESVKIDDARVRWLTARKYYNGEDMAVGSWLPFRIGYSVNVALMKGPWS